MPQQKRNQRRPSTASAPAGQLRHYLALTRLDRPIGTYLLLWPTLWALWIASNGQPSPRLFLIFIAGVVVSRTAGCVLNDLADRRIDREIRRTRSRPLARGVVSISEALVLFAGFGLVAIGLALALNNLARAVAVGATILLLVYPFTKRFLSVPQFILGAAFASAVPMVFAATTDELPAIAWLMFAVAVIWAVIYDTMYAMVDREDDIEAGVRSTAILFGEADRFVIAGLQVTMVLGLIMLGTRAGLGIWYYASIFIVALFFLFQLWLIHDRDRSDCFVAFRNNNYVGMSVFIGIALDYLFRVTP